MDLEVHSCWGGCSRRESAEPQWPRAAVPKPSWCPGLVCRPSGCSQLLPRLITGKELHHYSPDFSPSRAVRPAGEGAKTKRQLRGFLGFCTVESCVVHWDECFQGPGKKQSLGCRAGASRPLQHGDPGGAGKPRVPDPAGTMLFGTAPAAFRCIGLGPPAPR